MRGDVRALLVVALSIAIAASCALAQASSGGASKPAAQPPAVVDAEDEPSPPHIHFDVVSFKPCKEGIALTMKITIMPPDGDSIGYHCQTIGRILSFAYAGKQPFRLSGEPAWVDTDAYDFQAKVAPEDVAVWRKTSLDAKRVMVREMLAEVLNLKMHADTTTHPVYALVVAKGGLKIGPKLKEYKADEETKLAGGRVFKGRDVTWVGPDVAYYQGTTMAGLADGLGARLDREVVDKTGLSGMYDVQLTMPFLHYDPKTANVEDSKFAEIFDGLKELGLRLESSKAELNGIVVDHVERPPEN